MSVPPNWISPPRPDLFPLPLLFIREEEEVAVFREASSIDSERTASSVRSLYAKYSADEGWFDGTPDSVDRRILQAKKIANISKQASVRLAGRNAASQYIALAAEMDSDRASLEGLRRDILTAAADRDDEHYKSAESPHIRHRSAARHFVAEQECDDLHELTIRAQKHAQRLSSTLPMDESRVFVSSFVAAVRDAYEPPRTQRTAASTYVTPDFDPALFYLD